LAPDAFRIVIEIGPEVSKDALADVCVHWKEDTVTIFLMPGTSEPAHYASRRPTATEILLGEPFMNFRFSKCALMRLAFAQYEAGLVFGKKRLDLLCGQLAGRACCGGSVAILEIGLDCIG